MFQPGQVVVYGTHGVCRIIGQQEKDFMGTKRPYLVLKPEGSDGSTFYVPADNEKATSRLRLVMSTDEIHALIDAMPTQAANWIDDEALRREEYQRILADGSHGDRIRMIKAIFLHKQQREEAGKRLHQSDEHFLKQAEQLLYEEFGFVLQLTREEVLPYIFRRLEARAQ